MSTFTGIKDVDLKILSELDDRSMLNACATDKYVYNICKDEMFWRNRFVFKYDNEAAKYKPENRSWKNHYMQVIIDLDRFSKDPKQFLGHIIWTGDINNSYFVSNPGVPQKELTYVPLSEAPEWVLTNLYLLNLGPNLVVSETIFYKQDFKNATPIQVLNFISSKIKNNEYSIIESRINRRNFQFEPIFLSPAELAARLK